MQIKFTVSFAGPGFNVNAGEVRDMPQKDALRLIERGSAVPVREEAPVETTDKRTTARRATRRRG